MCEATGVVKRGGGFRVRVDNKGRFNVRARPGNVRSEITGCLLVIGLGGRS